MFSLELYLPKIWARYNRFIKTLKYFTIYTFDLQITMQQFARSLQQSLLDAYRTAKQYF